MERWKHSEELSDSQMPSKEGSPKERSAEVDVVLDVGLQTEPRSGVVLTVKFVVCVVVNVLMGCVMALALNCWLALEASKATSTAKPTCCSSYCSAERKYLAAAVEH